MSRFEIRELFLILIYSHRYFYKQRKAFGLCCACAILELGRGMETSTTRMSCETTLFMLC
jgi:hypothetical protein